MSLSLPHGCRTGKISVSPKNWEEDGADTGVDWFIHYRFHDPNFEKKYPKGLPVQVRGMNASKSLPARRKDTRGVLNAEIKALQEGYNPFHKRKVLVELNDLEISPDCPFPLALDRAQVKLADSKTKKEILKALKHIKGAIGQLKYDTLRISEVRRRHVLTVLEKVRNNKKEEKGVEWGASSWNHYRAYLIMLFKQLDICEAAEVNLGKIPMRKGVKKRRLMPSDEDMDLIDRSIREQFYTFWRFIHIFLRSGARMAELMQVRLEDLDLAAGTVYVVVRKRNGDAEQVPKTIMRSVASLWQEVAGEARPGDYLFAKGLRPGPVAINEHQVTQRWRVHIKKKLGVVADFYSLKKKHTTEVVSLELEKIRQAQQVAAGINSHTSTAMVQKHYDDLNNDRLHNQLRAI